MLKTIIIRENGRTKIKKKTKTMILDCMIEEGYRELKEEAQQ